MTLKFIQDKTRDFLKSRHKQLIEESQGRILFLKSLFDPRSREAPRDDLCYIGAIKINGTELNLSLVGLNLLQRHWET